MMHKHTSRQPSDDHSREHQASEYGPTSIQRVPIEAVRSKRIRQFLSLHVTSAPSYAFPIL
eukprot:6173977-Pleurochrysis_carterae.AAC.1